MIKRITSVVSLLFLLTVPKVSLHAADQEATGNSAPVFAHKDNTYFRKVTTIATAYNHAKEFMHWEKLEAKDILVVMDWDNTISMMNGTSLPFREDVLTRKTIQNIIEHQFQFMILTSRLAGNQLTVQDEYGVRIDPANFSAMLSCLSNMMTALNMTIPSIFKDAVYNYMFEPNGLRFGQHLPSSTPGLATLTYKNIVFAGAPDKSVKGESLLHLLESDYFIHQPKLIIFIDNDLDHLESMFTAFSKRPEIIVGLYFPQDEAETKNKVSLLVP